MRWYNSQMISWRHNSYSCLELSWIKNQELELAGRIGSKVKVSSDHDQPILSLFYVWFVRWCYGLGKFIYHTIQEVYRYIAIRFARRKEICSRCPFRSRLDPGVRTQGEDRSLDKLPSSRSPFTGLTNNVQCSMFPSRAIEPGSSSSSSSRFSPTAHWHSPPTYA